MPGIHRIGIAGVRVGIRFSHQASSHRILPYVRSNCRCVFTASEHMIVEPVLPELPFASDPPTGSRRDPFQRSNDVSERPLSIAELQE